MVRNNSGNGCGQRAVFVAVSVNFTSYNFTSMKSGYAAVRVSKDAMTASSIAVEITLQPSCGSWNLILGHHLHALCMPDTVGKCVEQFKFYM